MSEVPLYDGENTLHIESLVAKGLHVSKGRWCEGGHVTKRGSSSIHRSSPPRYLPIDGKGRVGAPGQLSP